MVVKSCRYFMVSACVCLSQSYKSGRIIELGGTCTMNRTADSLCVRYIVLRFCVACNYSTILGVLKNCLTHRRYQELKLYGNQGYLQ